jgi:Poly(ADP-ribose) polymerase catalytic domain
MWLKNQKASTRHTAVHIACFGESDLLTLQKYTDEYIKKKSNLDNVGTDDRLRALIDASKYWIHAFLSCAHLLSSEAVREYLIEILKYVQTEDQHINYLSILIFISKLNPSALSQDESDKARAILKLLHFKDGYETSLPHIKILLQRGIDDTLFVGNEMKLPDMTQTIWLSAKLYLSGMKENPKRWIQAASYTGWMTDLINSTERSIDLSPVDKSFPDWRAWALWSPDRERLLWIAQLPEVHITPLMDLLALEGPDFVLSKHKKLLYSAKKPDVNDRIVNGAITIDYRSIDEDPSKIIDITFELYKKASISSGEAFKLFKSVILRGAYEVEHTFKVLEAALAGPYIGRDQLLALEGVYAARSMEDRFAAIQKLLPFLEDPIMEDVKTKIVRYIGAILNGKAFTLLHGIRANYSKAKDLSTVQSTELDHFKTLIFKHPWLEKSIFGGRWTTIKSTPSTDTIRTLFEVNKWISMSKGNKSPKPLLDIYCGNKLGGNEKLNSQETALVEAFLGFWVKQQNAGHRQLALQSTGWKFLVTSQIMELLHSINNMRDEDSEALLEITSNATEMSVVNFAKIIASNAQMKYTELLAWREVLYDMISQYAATIVDWTASHLSFSLWISWLRNIRVIFGTGQLDRQPSALFDDDLHSWAQQLENISSSNLQKLEDCLEVGSALGKILLYSGNRPQLLALLNHLAAYKRVELNALYNLAFVTVPLNQDTIPKLWKLISRLSHISDIEIAYCERFIYLSSNASSAALTGIVASYLTRFTSIIYDMGFTASDIDLLRTLIPYFVHSNSSLPESLSEAASFLDQQYNQILQDVARINAMKTALKLHHFEKTSNLLDALGLEDDDSLLEIPDHLVDVVEQISFCEYEICFPLDHLKPLQRIALCVREARNIVVRINLQDGAEQPLYCVHLDPDTDHLIEVKTSEASSQDNARDHVYWNQEVVGETPDHHHCYSTPNITTSHIYRIVRRLMKNGFSSVEELHKSVSDALKNLARSCYSCGASHGVKLYRSVVCSATTCASFQLDPLLQFANFNADVYDILLHGVHNAVALNRFEFLPNCPLKTQAQVNQAIGKLPSMNIIANSNDRHGLLSTIGLDSLQLLSWISRFPGFISEATGQLKIPSMPGVRQFILANSSPAVEAARTAYYSPQAQTQVVFHGTSPDRLFPILNEGLRVGSGNSLQRIGASLGNGIYCATEPSTALSYAYASGIWGKSTLEGMRVVLGCELTGQHNLASTGIYVVPNATNLSVRYIFLFPNNVQAPISRHIVPALQSAYSLLRSGLA